MSTKRSHSSGYQKRSAKAKKVAASVKGVPANNSLFHSRTVTTSMPTATVTSELSEETEDTRTSTDSPQPPYITMHETVGVADADVRRLLPMLLLLSLLTTLELLVIMIVCRTIRLLFMIWKL